VIERILAHLGEPTRPPAVLPARPPPQGGFPFDQTLGPDDWPEMDQTAGQGGAWNRRVRGVGIRGRIDGSAGGVAQ
jgi:hypothetical protein